MIDARQATFEEQDAIARLGGDPDFQKLLAVLWRARSEQLELLVEYRESAEIARLQGEITVTREIAELSDRFRELVKARRAQGGS